MKRGVAAKLLPSCACFCVPRINPRVNGGEFWYLFLFLFQAILHQRDLYVQCAQTFEKE